MKSTHNVFAMLAFFFLSTACYAEEQKQLTEVELKRDLQTQIAKTGEESIAVGNILNNLANRYQAQRRYKEAELFYKRSLDILKKTLGSDHPDFSNTLRNLAILYHLQGRYAEAIPLYERVLAIREKVLGVESPDVGEDVNILAELYLQIDRYAEAEKLFKRSLIIREKVLGTDHPKIADSLGNLALIYFHQARYSDAEPLYKRSLAITQKHYGEESQDAAFTTSIIAKFYRDQARYAEAESLYKRALGIQEKIGAADDTDIAYTLQGMAGLYKKQGRYADAEPLYKRACAIYEKADNIFFKADCSYSLADLYKIQGRYAEAETLFQRVLAMDEKRQIVDSPASASNISQLAEVYFIQGHLTDAISYSRRAYNILKHRYGKAGHESEQQSTRGTFLTHISTLSHLPQEPAAVPESFDAAQFARTSSVGQSIAEMAARFASGSDELAGVIRKKQQISEQLRQADKQLLDVVSLPLDKRSPEEEANLRKRLTELETTLQQQTQDIAKRFPEYDALVSPAPMAVAEAQKLLKPDEAMVLFLLDDEQGYAWVVRPDTTRFITLPVEAKVLEKQVAKLRTKLDPEQNPDVEDYDATTANKVYHEIFAPLEDALKGAKHIIQVNDGALQSLPFTVLVDQIPKESTPTSWLADRYAFTVIPSVSSLRALRTFAHNVTDKEPFQGFGNPVLNGQPGQQRRLTSRALFATGNTTGQGTLRNGIADVEAIRKASPLPDTEFELKGFAQSLKAQPDSVKIQNEATETKVKRADLARYKILAFATHGVMAGELSGVAEPGLILTPPKEGTELDDGYLSASEVAQLKLNADWVILSACNTAAPDGKPGAEGLTGLAKGFFHAGARTLLVSNWYVVSDAATQLTTDMFKRYQANSKLGKAEALRQAMQALRQNPKFNHPLYWAPFSIVGEGL